MLAAIGTSGRTARSCYLVQRKGGNNEDLNVDSCRVSRAGFHRPSFRPRRENRQDCRRLRQSWRRVGCRYQYVLTEKDVTILSDLGRRFFSRRPLRVKMAEVRTTRV